ncbi:MAG TPA: xanthine dehydrogenase family protein molybdopterin-binding subunit [Polyangiaceae bacterium]|jgi:xanthine dehydrogenase YagR molybdenum-binding subunit|nr:xanthine dehydrogenase family protein molybdopterin-binding subunit [Polyangiaceae bacterium]
MKAFTGQGLDRVDGRLKVTGAAEYSADVPVANVAYAVIIGSAIASGKIARIDVDAARSAPGVLAVLTSANAPKPAGASAKGPQNGRVLQFLQDDRVYYDGQPVAVVVADTLERAQGAASLVEVTYETSPPSVTLDPTSSEAYAPEKLVRDPTDSHRGDFDAAFARAPVTVDATYTTPCQNHNPIELHATIAVWQGDDKLTLYDATQGVFGVKRKIARLFGLAETNVRVISKFLGGGFGCKGTPWSHVPIAAMAAKVVGRPVKVVITRQQMFAFVGHRPPTIQRVSLGATHDGKLTAIRHALVSHTSRFDEFVEGSAVVSRSLYACPNVETSHRLVRLDVATPTFMRAPGECTGNFALESAMDELGYALGMDPIALRLKNEADRDGDTDKPWSSRSLRQCYEHGAALFGWSRRSREPRSMRDGKWLVGFGVATATYPVHRSAASASARVKADGTAVVQSATQDIGTGTYTIMTQIAADALGLPFEHVRFELGDTAFPEAPMSAGSQTAASTGPAVQRAGLAARRQIAELAVADAASPLHGLSVTELDAKDGALFIKSDPARRDTMADVIRRNGGRDVFVEAKATEGEERKKYAMRSFGAEFAEVRVDPDLGEVRVARLLGVFGAGKILNEKTGKSQMLGGMVWGIGFALTERTRYDVRDGRVITRDLADYLVPVEADVPEVEIAFVDEVDAHVNELGAKGIGEVGLTGAIAAIGNAVFHATGKRVRDLPITVDKLI